MLCVRACVRACVRVCVRACVCVCTPKPIWSVQLFRYNLDGNLYHKPRSAYQSTDFLDLEFADAAAYIYAQEEL